jgi:hypothetical protein
MTTKAWTPHLSEWGSQEGSIKSVPYWKAAELIHQFFHGQHDWILRKLDAE